MLYLSGFVYMSDFLVEAKTFPGFLFFRLIALLYG